MKKLTLLAAAAVLFGIRPGLCRNPDRHPGRRSMTLVTCGPVIKRACRAYPA